MRNVNRCVGGMLSSAHRRGARRRRACPTETIARARCAARPGSRSAAGWRPGVELHAARRRQRLHGQGPVRRRASPSCRPTGATFARRGERDRRQHRALRRDGGPGVLPRPGRRALRGPQLGRQRGRRGRRRPRLRVHDRRARRRARPDRAQLRGRHERRRRLRARRGRRVRARAATRRCSTSSSELDDGDAIEVRDLVEEHAGARGSPVARALLDDWDGAAAALRQGLPARLQARAGRAGRAPAAPRRTSRRRRRRRGGEGRHDGGAERPDGRARSLPRRSTASASRTRDPLERVARLPTSSSSSRRDDELAAPGRALHGVRRAVLPQRLPARQPDPGLERPRLPRPLARGDRPAARDQQLPGVHRPAVPGAVRGRLRAGDPRGRRGHDQADRGLDHRPRVGRGLGRAAAARASRPAAASRSIGAGPGRPGRRAAAAPRRPSRSWCSSATRPAAA